MPERTLFNNEDALEFIRTGLREDVGEGDHTSLATLTGKAHGEAKLIAKEEGVIAGIGLAESIFLFVDEYLHFKALKNEGDKINVGDEIFTVSGNARSILIAERLALNCIQRLSGVATITAKVVKKVEGTGCIILDTRKTTPGFRRFEKWAVKQGGGENHRIGLFDMILIKDNHIDYAGGIANAINNTRTYLEVNELDLKVEIETRNMEELNEVLSIGKVDRIMLDNFTPAELVKAVKLINKRYETEASGGITIDNVREYAETGVDFISMGALTHSVKALDLSLKVKTS